MPTILDERSRTVQSIFFEVGMCAERISLRFSTLHVDRSTSWLCWRRPSTTSNFFNSKLGWATHITEIEKHLYSSLSTCCKVHLACTDLVESPFKIVAIWRFLWLATYLRIVFIYNLWFKRRNLCGIHRNNHTNCLTDFNWSWMSTCSFSARMSCGSMLRPRTTVWTSLWVCTPDYWTNKPE